MPRLNNFLSNEDRTPEVTFTKMWTKTSELAANHTTFCIDEIYITPQPDDYNKKYWVVRCMTIYTNDESRVYFKLPMSQKRDAVMNQLKEELERLAAGGGNDTLFHGCYIDLLPATQKGMNDTYLLKALNDKALDLNGCSCGYHKAANKPTLIGDLDI